MFEKLIFYFDLAGTVIFAVTGAVSAVKLRLDILGVIVFGCTVGVGGGMLRDSLIGATPVAALQNEVYLISCITVSLLIFFISPLLEHHKEIIIFCDAFGLGVFTAIGAAKGMQYDLGPAGIMLCGTLSAVGGGILRDVMARRIPAVLISDFYATASLIGGGIYILLGKTSMPVSARFAAVALSVILIRVLAIHFRLQLPGSRKKNLSKRT
ncbi:MAG: trimeric intracellular cation channel family protein [Lentisphaerae bacterium]|nr:trimeric intracellular cation channel family protein [Lentisphaerota bacterium]